LFGQRTPGFTLRGVAESLTFIAMTLLLRNESTITVHTPGSTVNVHAVYRSRKYIFKLFTNK